MLHETRTLSDIAVNWVLFCIKQEEIFMCFIQTTVKNEGLFLIPKSVYAMFLLVCKDLLYLWCILILIVNKSHSDLDPPANLLVNGEATLVFHHFPILHFYQSFRCIKLSFNACTPQAESTSVVIFQNFQN